MRDLIRQLAVRECVDRDGGQHGQRKHRPHYQRPKGAKVLPHVGFPFSYERETCCRGALLIGVGNYPTPSPCLRRVVSVHRVAPVVFAVEAKLLDAEDGRDGETDLVVVVEGPSCSSQLAKLTPLCLEQLYVTV